MKNIADFGAFVDLGGIDGLLHITDMSWGRIAHTTEMTQIDQEIEVQILNIDYEKEKVALGLKQKTSSPWESVAKKYPVESIVHGAVVNVMSYGAFVKLEDGIEGLVHISEMSWTKRVNHPSELVSVGDEVDVVVLDIDNEKMEVSLGMKQAESNPWDMVDEHYPVGTVIEGRVRNLTSYGAFVEIEEGIDGLLHVSDMSWTKKVTHPSEVFKKTDLVRAVVLSAIMFMTSQAMTRSPRSVRKLLLIDEAWSMLKGGSMGEFVETYARTARKYGGALATATQSLNDYYKSDGARAALENSDWMLVLQQKAETIADFKASKRLDMDDRTETLIRSLKRSGSDYSEVFIKGPETEAIGRLVLDDYSATLFSSSPQTFAAIDAEIARGHQLADAIERIAFANRT